MSSQMVMKLLLSKRQAERSEPYDSQQSEPRPTQIFKSISHLWLHLVVCYQIIEANLMTICFLLAINSLIYRATEVRISGKRTTYILSHTQFRNLNSNRLTCSTNRIPVSSIISFIDCIGLPTKPNPFYTVDSLTFSNLMDDRPNVDFPNERICGNAQLNAIGKMRLPDEMHPKT